MAENVLKGKRILGSSRAPKQIQDARVCADADCDTALSRYNRRDHCYTHAPTRFPRLRGRVIPEA